MADAGGIDPDHLAQLRTQALMNRPPEVLRLLIRLVPDLGSFGVIAHFKAVYPQAPFRSCIEAQAPAQLFDGGISDEEFDALFAPGLDYPDSTRI